MVMEGLIEHDGIDVWALISARFAPITGVLRRAFGCWHLQMSLPFTRDNETYRTCISCGARRRFDLDQWAMVGDFYHPQRQPRFPRERAPTGLKVRVQINQLNGERTICHCK